MENRYYTPQIEEFHVGFEYEVFVDKNFEYWDHTKGAWVKNEFYGGGVDQDGGNSEIEALRYLLEDNKADLMVRVKYLDKEDIESLGGLPDTHKGVLAWVFWVGKADFYLFWSPNSTVVSIKNSADQQIFRGMVKNKSRLLLLLKMIGIKLDVA